MNGAMRKTQCPPLAEFLSGWVVPGERVLDLGCGNKWYHPFLESESIVSVDAFPAAQPDVLLDLSQSPLPFADQSFDSVLMLDVIEHLERSAGETLLREAKRVARRAILLLTPLQWSDNAQSTEDADSFYFGNRFNYHRSLWAVKDFGGWARLKIDTLGRYFVGSWNTANGNSDDACIENWKALHNSGYFPAHRKYRGLPVHDIHHMLEDTVGLNTDDEVLEIGCGYGGSLLDVAPHVRRAVGIDLHRDLFGMAQSVPDNVTFTLCDGKAIPYPSQSFDMVFSIAAMQHIPRALVRGYTHEAARVLRPGGRLCFQFPADPTKHADIDPTVKRETSVAWSHEQLEELGGQIGNMKTTIQNIGRSRFLVGRDRR